MGAGTFRCHPSECVDRAIRTSSNWAAPPVIDWAVMQDPFGNEFCLVADLTVDQSLVAMHAKDATTDGEWRVPAGVRLV